MNHKFAAIYDAARRLESGRHSFQIEPSLPEVAGQTDRVPGWPAEDKFPASEARETVRASKDPGLLCSGCCVRPDRPNAPRGTPPGPTMRVADPVRQAVAETPLSNVQWHDLRGRCNPRAGHPERPVAGREQYPGLRALSRTRDSHPAHAGRHAPTRSTQLSHDRLRWWPYFPARR